MRRVLVVLGALAIMATAAQPVAARTPLRGDGDIQPANLKVLSSHEGAKSATGKLAQSDPDLVSRSDSKIVPVMIKYDFDPLASYQGDIQGFSATSPSATGQTLKSGGASVASYKLHIGNEARLIGREIMRQVPSAKLGTVFLTAFGGASALIPANKAKDLLKVQGVAAVMYDTVNQPQDMASPVFVGADQVWPTLGGSSTAGAGVVVGVLDTGIWPENPMLDDPGIPNPGGGPYDCDFGLSGETHDDAFACNDKMLGAYAFLDTNILVNGYGTGEYCTSSGCSARDADGHGTHTSTTAAGSPVASTPLLGVDRGPTSGIAPGASVIMYRVCNHGCYSSDSVSAVEQAILDGVDVINFSISGGSNAYSDSVELAFLDAYAAGIMVNASAGNDGPGAATANHAGPWTNTVGASTLDRAFETTLHLTADGGATLDVGGVSVTSGVSSPTPVVLASAAPYSSQLCTAPAAGGTFTGMVVVCERGSNARIEKGYNVSLGGAAGMVLYNTAVTDVETDNHFLPAIHVNDQASTIAAFVSGHTGVMATWAASTASPAQGDVMASFSSRGPLGDFIKPDVTAPGVQILAGNALYHEFDPADGLGPNGENFQAIAGTSMSSPHAAGVAALIKAAHPSWTPGQIKSAMMTSSVQDVVKEDGSTPADPFDDGAGSIRANRAVNPTVTFEASVPDFFASASDPMGRINLNIASVNAPQMDGVIETTRTARNVTGHSQTLNITTKSPAGAKITVSPNKIVLPPFGSKSFSIRIEASSLPDGQYFGQITLNPKAGGYLNAVLPVAFNKAPGDVTLDHYCDSTTLARFDTASCTVDVTNYSSEPAHVNVKVKGENAKAIKVKNFSDGNKKGNGFTWNGTLDPSLPPPIEDMSPPGDGFLDISFLTPEPDLWGDETIVNYDISGVDAAWGDKSYDTIGITSNGYLVMGGGTSQDVDYVPQSMPDPARPNAVLAPYWTDLNFNDGGNVYFGLDNDGTWYTFLVIQFDHVPVYGTCATTCETRTFQVWIGTKYFADTYFGGGSYITFEYDSGDIGPGSADGLNVGAEDAFGLTAAQTGVDTSQTFVPNTSGYFVEVGAAQAGGSMSLTYDAYAKKVGDWPVRATMTSDVSVGTAKKVVNFHVTP